MIRMTAHHTIDIAHDVHKDSYFLFVSILDIY